MATDRELIESKKSELARSVIEALGDRLPESHGALEGALNDLLEIGLTINPPEYSTYI